MRCLPDLSLEAALQAPPFAPFFTEPLGLEFALTEAYKANEGIDPSLRELAVLQVQFPAVFQRIQEEDLFAGRLLYPLVSFGPEPGGLGYACREEAIREVLAKHPGAEAVRVRAEALLAYWQDRSTEARTRAAFPAALSSTLPSDAWTKESGIAFPLYRIAGLVPDYQKLVRVGLPGLRKELQKRLGTCSEPEGCNFLKAALGALDLLQKSCLVYAAEAETLRETCISAVRTRELERITASLRAITQAPPSTLHEGIQLVWLYALHAGTWNHGRADVYLGDLLEADLSSGRLDEEEALRFLESWWRLLKAYDNQYNNRIYLGGLGRPKPASSDRFARLAIEATRRVRLNQPQLSLRFHREQDPTLMEQALTALGEGCTFPMLYNDEVNVPAVSQAFGVSLEEALDYHPYGCGEYVLASHSVDTPNAVLNLTKCLEAALHEGLDPWSGKRTGPLAPAPESFRTFEQVWEAYAAQVEHHVSACALHQKIEYEVTGRDCAFLFASLLHHDCLPKAKPLLRGGLRYVGGTLETYGNTNAADALHAIDTLVFREGALSLRQIVEACDANFEGATHAAVRRRLLRVPKYGNDDPAADALAQRVHRHVCGFTRDQASVVGLHHYLVVLINNWANVIFGSTTGASPDGRRSGEALANGNNPAPGADTQGASAFLNSLVKLDPRLHAGAVQNMKFGPELFRAARPKLEALLAGYWQQGGTQAMITVVCPSDLEAAMREPEKWAHLMVRVGGFSARFIDLPKGAQEEILRRTCHL